MSKFLLSIFLLTAFSIKSQGQIPNGYYSGTGNIAGNTLKTNLHKIIDNHKEYPYTSGNTDIWDILKKSDKNPKKQTDVILIYSGNSVDGGQEYNSGNGWNREHVWPQSLGQFNTSNTAGKDAHNLKPCDIKLNTVRGNKEFDNGGSPVNCAADTYQDNDSWEPMETVKGDLARIIFYMVVRYNGDVSGEPDLSLYNKTNGNAGKFGNLDTLLKWHQKDPVSQFERDRNNTIYSYQNNRNPFIDSPQFAQCIWTNNCPENNRTDSGINKNLATVKNLDSELTQTVKLSWNDTNLGPILPDYYLVLGHQKSFNAVKTPKDGQRVPNGVLAKNIQQGKGEVEFELKKGETYYFKIYPYTNLNNPNYKIGNNVQRSSIKVQ